MRLRLAHSKRSARRLPPLTAASDSGCLPGKPGGLALLPAGRCDARREQEETWEAFYLQGTKIGYGQTTVRSIDRGGRPLVEMKSLNHLSISRFGQQTEQDVTMSTLETPQGELLEFATDMSAGPRAGRHKRQG